MNRQIVRTIEPLPVIVVGEGHFSPFRGQHRNPPIPMFTGDKSALGVKGQPV